MGKGGLAHYGGINGNFVLVDGRGEGEAESAEQPVKAVADALVEAIEAGLGRRYRQEWGREDRPLRARRRGQKDVVKKLQEDQADGIALGRQAVARQLFNKALGAQLG